MAVRKQDLVRRSHRLIAACYFAKDVLNSFLLPVARRARPGKFRDIVGAITLQIEAATLGEAVAALRIDFDEVKRALRDDKILPNDAKEQVWSRPHRPCGLGGDCR